MSRRVNSSSVIDGQSLADSLLDFMNASASERGNISLSPPIDDEQLNKYLSFESDDFRWKGTSDQLKRFFAEDLKLSGKWKSSSGGVWSFSTKEYEVKWQKSMKLVVIRDTTDNFMLNCLMKSLANDNLNDNSAADLNNSSVKAAASLCDDHVETFEESINDKLDCILKTLSDLKQISILQEQNKSLRKSLEDLEFKHSSLMCIASELKIKIKTLEDEKSGLITALKLVSCEAGKDDETCKEVYPKKCEENGLNVQPPAKYRSKHKSKSKSTNKGSINNNLNQQTEQSGHSPVNPPNNAQANPTNNAECNSHDLGENYNNQSVGGQNNVNQSVGGLDSNDPNESVYSKHDGKSKFKKKVTVIAGDSIIKHLQGWRLSDTNNHVVVKSFSVATIEDMEDYLKPVIRKEPESIVLHIGTNDLNKLSPKQAADSITNLGIQINEESPNTTIVICSILLRTDKPNLATKATEANKLLTAICSKNKWKFVNHQSINQSCLNSRGLHLNRKGSSIVADNLRKLICTQ